MSAIAKPMLAPPEPIKRISVEQYHAIIRAGIFDDDDPIELLEGWMVEKMPKNPLHSVVTGLLSDAVAVLLPPNWHVITQEPITTEDSEPEPDLGVIRGKRRDYLRHHPRPGDVGLLVEVSDTTLERDRGVKKLLYARARIPVYWIVNLIDRCVEVFSNPTGPARKPDYREHHVQLLRDSLLLVLDGTEFGRIKVKQLLP